MAAGDFSSQKLAVVGLGLMGGSIALALKDYADQVIGVDPNPATCAYALDRGIVDDVAQDLQSGVSDADTVILATPVRVCLDMLEKRLGSYLRSNTLLIDIGSTKNDICEAMGQLPIGINAIGGHPMTGKESSGIGVADGGIFFNRPFVLCDTRRTTPATRLRAKALVKAIGSIATEMDAKRHDKIVAGISHLPYILSASLVATIAQQADSDEAFWELAAGGFRDSSRLAGSNIQMMADILSTNTQAVATLLAMFRVQLAQIEAMLISGEEDKLVETLEPVRQSRLDWTKNYEQKR